MRRTAEQWGGHRDQLLSDASPELWIERSLHASIVLQSAPDESSHGMRYAASGSDALTTARPFDNHEQGSGDAIEPLV